MDEMTEPISQPDLRQERKYFSRIGWMLVCSILITGIFQMWIAMLYGATLYQWISVGTVMAVMLVGQYVIVIPVCYVMTMDIPRVPLGEKTVTAAQFFKWFAAGCAVSLVGSVLGSLVHTLVYALLAKAHSDALSPIMDSMNPMVAFLCVCLIGPIMEELVFRHFITGCLARNGEKTAIMTSALLFGLFHGNFQQFFYAFGLGVILGYIYIRTGRLRWSIFLHMAFNVYGSFASLFLMDSKMATGIWGCIMLACSIYGIAVWLQNGKTVILSRDGVQLRARVRWGNVGMALALIACLIQFIISYVG